MILDCYKPVFARRCSSNSLTVTPAAAIVTAPPFSFACWFMVNDVTNPHGLFWVFQTAVGTEYFDVTVAGNVAGDPLQARARSVSTGSSDARTTTPVLANVWMHATAVFASTTDRRVYLNGGGVGSSTTLNTPLLLDGTQLATGGIAALAGLLAWPAVWNLELTTRDIAQLAARAPPNEVKPENRVAFWDWTGSQSEWNQGIYPGAYKLVNSGTVPVMGPGFLRRRIARPWLRSFASTGNRRRRVICGAA